MKIIHITTCIISFFLISNCASKAKDGNHSGTKDDKQGKNLTEIYWRLTELSGKPVSEFPAQNKEPYILLIEERNRVEGTGGCNSMGGSYVLKGENQITFSNLIATEMACPGMELESEFHKALQITHSYESNGKELKLHNESGGLVALFQASSGK